MGFSIQNKHSLWGTPVTLGNLHIRCPPVASRLLIGHDFPNDLSADRRFIEGRPCRSQNHHAKKIGKIRYIYKYVYVCIYTIYIYMCIYIFGESWSKNIIQDYFWWIFHLQQNYLHLFITSIGAGDFNPSPKSLGIIKEHSKPSTGTVFLDVFLKCFKYTWLSTFQITVNTISYYYYSVQYKTHQETLHQADVFYQVYG